MAQFDVFENPNSKSEKTYPFLLEIQSNLLSDLETTVVVPLIKQRSIKDFLIQKLFVEVKVENETYFALVQQLAGVHRNQLGKHVDNLAGYRSELIAAIDFLVTGI